jgi:hypothetical protein
MNIIVTEEDKNDLSYFNKPILNTNLNTYKFYNGLSCIIYCVNDKYYLKSSQEKSILLNLPINTSEGEVILGIHSTTDRCVIIITNKNTYYIADYDKVHVLNFICSHTESVTNGLLLKRNICIFKTIDNKTKFLYLNFHNVNRSIVDEPLLITNRILMEDNDYFKYIDSLENCHSIIRTMIPTEILCFSNKTTITLIDDMFFALVNEELQFIEQNFVVKRIFVDDSTKTLYNGQRFYVLDTDGYLWTLDFDNLIFVKICKLLQTNEDQEEIVEIISTKNNICVIGSYFIDFYKFKFGDIPILDDSLVNNALVSHYEVDKLGFNQFELISNIWKETIVIKYKKYYILIASKKAVWASIILNPNILLSEVNYFKIPDYRTYLLQGKDDVIVNYSHGRFYTLSENNIYYEDNTNVISDYVQNAKKNKYDRKKFNDHTIYVDNQLSYFNVIYHALIATNYSYYLDPQVMIRSVVMAMGPGTNRDVYNTLMEEIKKELFECIATNTVFNYKINLNNTFWHQPTSCFYFGMMLAYLIDSGHPMNFHLSLTTLSIIYEKLIKINLKQKFHIDNLAPFHKMINPTEFQMVLNMPNECKTNDTIFKELSLGYDSFLDMIKSMLKLEEVSKLELDCLQTIALGINKFNSTIANNTMYELSVLLGGNFIYNRQSVIDNIFVKFETNIDTCKTELDKTDSVILTYIDKVKYFIDNLNDEELKRFMINVTGHIISTNNVEFLIYPRSFRNVDITIVTCKESIKVVTSLLDQDNYIEILKGYLCTKDSYIKDNQ